MLTLHEWHEEAAQRLGERVEPRHGQQSGENIVKRRRFKIWITLVQMILMNNTIFLKYLEDL